jgi:hypothetical protein
MRSKCQVVELYRWRKAFVPQRVLMAYLRRVEEGRIRNEIRKKAQNVDGWEVDGGTRCRASAEIQDRLRVEGGRPAKSVDPTEEFGNNLKE